MEMNPNPEMTDEDNPEWTEEMFARAMRIGDLPEGHRQTLRAVGRPKKPDAKVLISLRVKPSLADAYKAKGKGWRLEMEKVLAEALNQ